MLHHQPDTGREYIPLPSIDLEKGDEITRNESVEDTLLRECCLSYDQLASLCQLQQSGEPVLHLMTQGRENILSYQPRVYKHQLLKSSPFRARIIDYYKSLGYAWVDIVVLNRHYWKIFLFQHDPQQ